MTHPAVPACLTTPYSAKPRQKGGTLIAEDVTTREMHRELIEDPDGYRPRRCGHCGERRLHAHDFRDRVLRADPDSAAESIRRFVCVSCHAIWQVLPAFLARHLHRNWATVQSVMAKAGLLTSVASDRRIRVPERTVRRWAARLEATAIQLVQLLATAGGDVLPVLGRIEPGCSRARLVDVLAEAGLVDACRKVAQVAAWVHRLLPGIRLM